MAQYDEDRMNGYPHATQQNVTLQTPSITHKTTGLVQAAAQPIKIGVRPLDLNNKADRKAMNYVIQSNGRNTRNGNSVAGMQYGQNKYGIQWGSDGRIMSQSYNQQQNTLQTQNQMQSQVQDQTQSKPLTYQNKTSNTMGILGRYRNKVGNGQTYTWDADNNAFYTEGNNVGVGTTGLAHSGANVQLNPNTRYNFGNNRIGRKLGAAYDATTGTINTANLGRRSMRRLRKVLNRQGISQDNVQQQSQVVQGDTGQQTSQTTGQASGQTPGRQSILSQNFPNLFAPRFSLNNQIPIFQPNWNPNFNVQPAQEQDVVEQEQQVQQPPQTKKSEADKYTAYIDQMNANIGKPEEEQYLNDYITNMNNNIGVPESQQSEQENGSSGFLGWLGNTISVQTTPTASSAAAFGQYMPTYQSTYGRELGTLGATIAAPFIPSATSALAGGAGGTGTIQATVEGTGQGAVKGLIGRGVQQGTATAARPALQAGWKTGGQFASKIKNMDNWRKMFSGKNSGEISAILRSLQNPRVWARLQRIYGFEKGGILKAQQGAQIQAKNSNTPTLDAIINNPQLAEQFLAALSQQLGKEVTLEDLTAAAANPEMGAQLEQLAQQMMKQSAKQGAKLEYIARLRGKCPEGQELVYFAKGGKICSACMGKKMEDGGEAGYMKSFRDRQKKKQMEKCGGKMKKSK